MQVRIFIHVLVFCLKYRNIEGQKIAKKLSIQISKETEKLRSTTYATQLPLAVVAVFHWPMFWIHAP